MTLNGHGKAIGFLIGAVGILPVLYTMGTAFASVTRAQLATPGQLAAIRAAHDTQTNILRDQQHLMRAELCLKLAEIRRRDPQTCLEDSTLRWLR